MLSRTAQEDSTNKKYNVFNCMKDSLKYNKKAIMIFLSFIVIFLTFTYLGPILSIISFLTILLIYFRIIPISIFTSSLPPNLSELVSDKQASKSCNENSGSTNNNNSKSTNKSSKTNVSSKKDNLLQKIGGFLPKFPQIFPSLDVVETYDTKLPDIPYPDITIGKFNPELKIPKEVEINFPDIKLPGIPQSVTDTVKVVQDKAIEGLNNINDAIHPNPDTNVDNNIPNTSNNSIPNTSNNSTANTPNK